MTGVDTLIAMEEIRALKARYCRYLDTKQWDEWGGLFAEDATLDVSAETLEAGDLATDAVVRGRAAIVAQVRDAVGPAITAHHVHNPELEILGPDEARAVWAMEDFLRFPDDPSAPFSRMNGFGHYHETYRRGSGGWVIVSVKLTRLHREFS